MNAPNDYKAFAEHLADLARPIARRYFRSDLKVIDKPDATPVTLADMEIEARLREEIAAHFPHHGILGEEEDPKNIDAEFVWVIDPIDGTKAFTVGKPQFGTLVGLCRNGDPIVGVIDQAITDERWVGAKGEGAWFNGQPMRRDASGRSLSSRHIKPLAETIVLATSPSIFSGKATTAYDQLQRACKGFYWGGDCYNFAMVAQDNAALVFEAGLKTVDFIALVNPIIEAGGYVCDFDGKPLTMQSDGTIIAAANQRLAVEVLAVIQS
ncbi:MAG: inositol monophosphatase family protein [Betaproteobacteria bacterium]|nr:MAG: inositol monophosphatase family protein [Betaproteobacteria bacterium]